MEKRTYTAANQTKRALAAVLKELMGQKSLNKITIHDLTERCGIRRQNFYYHFEDVYGLLRWTFEEEALSLLEQHEGPCSGRRGCCSSSAIWRKTRPSVSAPCGPWAGMPSSNSSWRISAPLSTAPWSRSAGRSALWIPTALRWTSIW